MIDLRTDDERMGALEFDLTPAEVADAKVMQAQIDRQRRDRNELDNATHEARQKPMREQWLGNVQKLYGLDQFTTIMVDGRRQVVRK
jgi:hypothetical protein